MNYHELVSVFFEFAANSRNSRNNFFQALPIYRNCAARQTGARGNHRARLEEHHEPRADSGGAGGRRDDFAGRALERRHAGHGRSVSELGFKINVEPDRRSSATAQSPSMGVVARLPKGARKAKPLDLFVGNAGTAARFLAAVSVSGQGRLSPARRAADERASAGGAVSGLARTGYRVESQNDKLPRSFTGPVRARANAR